MKEKPASWRISARRGEAEARISFMVLAIRAALSQRTEIAKGYYSVKAATACALVRPKRRAQV
jgi:hypothetical protein